MTKRYLFVVVLFLLFPGTALYGERLEIKYQWLYVNTGGKPMHVENCWLCLKDGNGATLGESGLIPGGPGTAVTLSVTNSPSSLSGAWAQCHTTRNDDVTVWLPYAKFTTASGNYKNSVSCHLGYREPYMLLGFIPCGKGDIYLSCSWAKR